MHPQCASQVSKQMSQTEQLGQNNFIQMYRSIKNFIHPQSDQSLIIIDIDWDFLNSFHYILETFYLINIIIYFYVSFLYRFYLSPIKHQLFTLDLQDMMPCFHVHHLWDVWLLPVQNVLREKISHTDKKSKHQRLICQEVGFRVRSWAGSGWGYKNSIRTHFLLNWDQRYHDMSAVFPILLLDLTVIVITNIWIHRWALGDSSFQVQLSLQIFLDSTLSNPFHSKIVTPFEQPRILWHL